jgi:hypothetical protein
VPFLLVPFLWACKEKDRILYKNWLSRIPLT